MGETSTTKEVENSEKSLTKDNSTQFIISHSGT